MTYAAHRWPPTCSNQGREAVRESKRGMVIYALDVFDAEEGCMVSWHATKEEAETLRKELAASGREILGIEAVEIPTDERGLLKWLNLNYRRR